MRVAVIGAGATGGQYGGLHAQAGHDVVLLARGAHLAAIRERGLEIRSAQLGTFAVHPRATDDPAQLGQADFVLVAVKTYDLDAAAQAAKLATGPDTAVLTLQNGVDAPDRVAAVVGPEHTLIGTTSVETTVAEPGVVAHLSPGHRLTLSELDGPVSPRVERLVGALREANIHAVAIEDGRRALWDKASFLIPMALLTSVCRQPIGPILDFPATRDLLLEVCREVAAVGRARGVGLDPTAEPAMRQLASFQPTMKSSLQRDFERGARTEIDALGGTLVRLAEQHHVSIPALRTIYPILALRQQSPA
jgi:2-dehydropantoate 2-reductase